MPLNIALPTFSFCRKQAVFSKMKEPKSRDFLPLAKTMVAPPQSVTKYVFLLVNSDQNSGSLSVKLDKNWKIPLTEKIGFWEIADVQSVPEKIVTFYSEKNYISIFIKCDKELSIILHNFLSFLYNTILVVLPCELWICFFSFSQMPLYFLWR